MGGTKSSLEGGVLCGLNFEHVSFQRIFTAFDLPKVADIDATDIDANKGLHPVSVLNNHFQFRST
jgi:hypothetical protein